MLYYLLLPQKSPKIKKYENCRKHLYRIPPHPTVVELKCLTQHNIKVYYYIMMDLWD